MDRDRSADGGAGALAWSPAPSRPRLEEHDVHLWQVELTGGTAEIARAAATLAPDERARMERYHFERDRERFALRRAALREILARYLEAEPRSLEFRVTTHGKPQLASATRGGAPRLRFNPSHSEALAIVGVTIEAELGVDVECSRAFPDRDEVARTVFSPAELAEYRAVAADQREAAFFNGWTRKEAWLKARGEGLIGDLAGFDVTLAPGREPRLLRVGGSPGEAAAWRLLAFAPREGYVGALAVRDRECRVLGYLATLSR